MLKRSMLRNRHLTQPSPNLALDLFVIEGIYEIFTVTGIG